MQEVLGVQKAVLRKVKDLGAEEGLAKEELLGEVWGWRVDQEVELSI